MHTHHRIQKDEKTRKTRAAASRLQPNKCVHQYLEKQFENASGSLWLLLPTVTEVPASLQLVPSA